MDASGQSCSEDARHPASKRLGQGEGEGQARQGEGQAGKLGTGQPGLINGLMPPFQRTHLDAWLQFMRREDLDVLAGAVSTE